MTDTGQVPGEGLPENAGTVEQPGVLTPGAYTYLDPSDTPAEDDDLLLMPGQQGAWGNEMPQPGPAPAQFAHEPGPHEAAGRDSGSIDLGGVRTPSQASAPQRRPLHLGPPTPDASSSPVRSLADRGPADVPMRASGPPTAGPEYLDVPQLGENSPQGAVPWGAPPQAQPVPPAGFEGMAAETVAPAPMPEPVPAPAVEAEPGAPVGSGPLPGHAAPAGSEALEASAPPADAELPQVPGVTQDAQGGSVSQAATPHVADATHGVPAPDGAFGLHGGVPGAEPGHAPQDASAPSLHQIPEAAALSPTPDVSGTLDAVPTAEAVPHALSPDATAFAPQPDARQQADDTAHAGAAVPAADAGVPGQTAGADVPAYPGAIPPPAQAPEPVPPAPAEQAQDPAEGMTPVPGGQAPEPGPVAPVVHVADTEGQVPDAAAQLAEPAATEVERPAVAEAARTVPSAVTAQGVVLQATAEQGPGEQPAHAEPAAVPAASAQSPQDPSLGQFLPVEGAVPHASHLSPTPPHALSVPPLPAQEQQFAEEPAPAAAEQEEPVTDRPAAEEPVVIVPAPREGEAPAPEPLAADPESVVAQQADDLDTRAADQEESTAEVADVRESTGPAAPGYDDAEREAVLRVMRERRDIRNGFRGDPIPHDVLLRVLEAAHTAPSVGHSQPWDFVVIRSAETRRTMHELAQRQREAYAKSLPKGRAKQFKELKIEAILDTPVNIVVTADPTRGGRHTLGRHTQPQMAPYSSALAVENLWLAARAEGLGVGWVSFFDEREMVRALGLPEHLEVVAYLCVGYVDEFPEEPELMQAGWSKRRPLSWVVHEETYGRRALPGEEPHDLLAETVAGIRPLDAKALGEAWERQKRMTKPAGALGMLEIISAQLSGLSRQCPPPIPEPAAVAIFAGDHGVHAQGVTPWPQEVTGQMVANFLGGGAVCNAFANQVGAEVCVVDVGVAADLPATPGLLPRKVRAGTADMTTGPALTREEVKQAIEVGIETARDLVAAGNRALLTGEMGIANTTASAALISVFTDTDPSEVTGRGTGINDETLARKTEVVRRAIELHQPDPADPIGVLAAFGGLEHAAMVGLLLGGASLRTPVILDGVSAGAAALVARALAPEVLAACIAGHRSAEPGHVAALNKLGLRPLVDLDLRLGEGTGALLALPLVQSAARAMHEVATFDSAGVTEK
ncbi:nicotinate-nucleotide--dimethylbenzimidazole phosphoribosyltransferase [Streptomyces hygroscopicus]|uniref:nicotinate-nucleotide--dimethylbenzimidazole phosphoribosyltransferase n=1 Tax=Streptomyces hygroscopicus TaxID=1912 RepID=UPI00223F0C58|nr:nicotinate-nucleotide--dimethylbenzimidazole phosphoribosyltransferase [Streptomyces hygroscopicus]MCW7941005.1 nicotinate-nucleotide--dimethylbenzimidazole phosphoribosyltransferase [Streptomyces hygroscopicus]